MLSVSLQKINLTHINQIKKNIQNNNVLQTDTFIPSFKAKNQPDKEKKLLEEGKNGKLIEVKDIGKEYTTPESFFETIRPQNAYKKYLTYEEIKENGEEPFGRITGEEIKLNQEARKFIKLLENIKSEKEKLKFILAYCRETGFPDFSNISKNIENEISKAIHSLGEEKHFKIAFIGYDKNCSVGRETAFPGKDCDGLFMIIEPQTDEKWIAESTRWQFKDEINQTILSTPATSLPEVLTTDYIEKGLELAETIFGKSNFNEEELKRFEENKKDSSKDFVKAAEFNIRLAEQLPTDIATRDLFYKTAMLVELVREGRIIENNFSDRLINKIKNSVLFNYSNLMRQEAFKDIEKNKHKQRRKLIKEFYSLSIDQQFEIIKSNIYSSYKIPTNENKQLFTNTDTNGKDEMGNIEEMYHQLMNKTI